MAEPLWYLTKDGDRSCIELYEKHYSCYHYKDGRKRSQFVGPGESIVLRTERADAAFVWRQFIDDSGQAGINCAFFRSEGPYKASELIRQADAIADHVWPGQRHYTFVDEEEVRGTCPGYCFIRAGYRRCGYTQSGRLILARRPVLKPRKAEYDIGRDAYDRQVTLKFERTYDGKEVWTIHREEANQRDNPESVSGLTANNLRALAAAVS